MATSAVDIGAAEKSAGYQEWTGTIPLRNSTAAATSQPPISPTMPQFFSQGGSHSISSVPAVRQTSAGTIARAKMRAAGLPPGVLRTDHQVGSTVTIDSATSTKGWAVENRASVAPTPASVRAVAGASRNRLGATITIASPTSAI